MLVQVDHSLFCSHNLLGVHEGLSELLMRELRVHQLQVGFGWFCPTLAIVSESVQERVVPCVPRVRLIT
jgi:hypothetical protein